MSQNKFQSLQYLYDSLIIVTFIEEIVLVYYFVKVRMGVVRHDYGKYVLIMGTGSNIKSFNFHT